GIIPGRTDTVRIHQTLYRDCAVRWKEAGATVHAVSAYACDREFLEAFSLTGFGKIMFDGAVEMSVFTKMFSEVDRKTFTVRRATPADAGLLSTLDSQLAAHVEASPVFLPSPTYCDPDQWREWLSLADTRAWIVFSEGVESGFLKAQVPQDDVSDAVKDNATIAINGLYMRPQMRGRGMAQALCAALADSCRGDPFTRVSVDCETMNIEAYSFWTRWFKPVAYTLERRIR
ncbi:MAG: GNAT family N-acetyltransferase, partial [Chitinivibrionales bacterium]|nr:GNAT family N-acetyltransferase [Chitinivibrionales bacterium]